MPPLVFPQTSTADALSKLVDQALTLRLYTNNKTPQVIDTITSYVEASGGGYAAIPLLTASWTIYPGSPSVALYNSYQTFLFTGPTSVPTIYGYYITTPDDIVLLAEEFSPSDIPFIPALNQTIQIRPRFGADNLIEPPVELESIEG
jgi:hypothetical protein